MNGMLRIIGRDGIIDEAIRWDNLTEEEKEIELIPIRKQLKENGWMK